jgi:hypothetical protein
MAQTLEGVVTDKGREVLAKSLATLAGYPSVYAYSFKYGEGGWVQTGSGKIPKDPNPALLDVEATGAAGDMKYEKNFIAADMTFISPSTIEFRCKLDPTEANDDGLGNSPKFFELGIFDQNGNMLSYATFDEQTKTATKSLISYVQVSF